MTAIAVREVSKVYRLYRKPSDRLWEALLRRPRHRAFRSLEQVSFAVDRGECLGIIGDNGAGKSTMLKIIAGTLTPTAGKIETHGRVAALLELGAGFHYEFTGRQNIWINAALMGLERDEIAAREAAIIDFAELGEFIDRPIKTYSSGMVVRLAFAIATSVDPDILIIDEALSVGDHYFQKKSIDRMLAFKERGKTILFCSHAMYLVNQLCERAIWFEHGRLREEGPATHVTAAYESASRERERARTVSSGTVGMSGGHVSAAGQPDGATAVTGEGVQLSAPPPVAVVAIRLNGSTAPLRLHQGEGLEIDVVCKSWDPGFDYYLAAGIRRNDNIACHAVNMAREGFPPLRGDQHVTLRYPSLPFLHGEFSVVVFVFDTSGMVCLYQNESAGFTVLPANHWDQEIGLLKLEHQWCRHDG
jgi:ABC-type polysaccharide/polyol phosphate transport system ATPase subunit